MKEGGKEEDFDYEQDGGEVLKMEDSRRDLLVLSEFVGIHNKFEG
jgi:hypothetical protein